MTNKHKGGRGLKAETPYERLSFTMPPHLKAYLDAQAEGAGVSRSEMLARILEDHQAQKQQPKPAAIPEGESTTLPLRGTSTARTAPRKEKSTHVKQADPREDLVKPAIARLAEHVPVLGVIQKEVPRGLGWKPKNYEKAEVLLSHGDRLFADGVNYRTAKGGIVGYRTAEALFRLGVLVEIKQIN